MVGVLFQRATPDNPADPTVAELLTHVSDDGSHGAGSTVTVQPGSLWDDASGYFAWQGSLTTPPCSGGVRWMLQREVRAVSQEQCAAFKEHAGYLHGNARPTQPLNGRTVNVYQPGGGGVA